MPRIEQSVDITASQPEVFRFCHDVARRANWDEQVARVELLTPPPIRQGSLLRFDASQAVLARYNAPLPWLERVRWEVKATWSRKKSWCW